MERRLSGRQAVTRAIATGLTSERSARPWPRRALLIAPTYDDVLCKPTVGVAEALAQLRYSFEELGGYETQHLEGAVSEADLRRACTALFDTEGEALLYFYGHCLSRPPGLTVLCKSEARADEEGYLLSELMRVGGQSEAREAIVIVDGFQPGQASGPSCDILSEEAKAFVSTAGRAFIASCGSDAGPPTGLAAGSVSPFTAAMLEGLRGSGRLPGTDFVSASALFSFVAAELGPQGQRPVLFHHETGTRRCRVVKGGAAGPSAAESGSQTLTLRLGVPFAPSTTFFGREAELEFLRAYLCNDDRPLSLAAAVEGLGGIGKTELVLHLVHDEVVSRTFPTILWFDASAPLPPQWEYFASRYGDRLDGADPKSLMQQVISKMLAKGRVLVVLDNASRWDEVRPFISDDVSTIVTTRSRTFGDSSFVRHELGTLAPYAAIEFLEALLPEAERGSLDRLSGRLAGHPLALELAGHYIRDMCTPDEYLEQLDSRAELASEAVAEQTHYGRTLDTCLQISWDGLRSQAARSLWVRASLFAPTSAHRDLLRITAESPSVSHYLGEPVEYFLADGGYYLAEGPAAIGHLLDPSEFPEAYRELRAAHVLSRVEGHVGERWAMHRIVRDFGRRRLTPEDVEIHAGALAGWLRDPTLPVEPEAPHIVAAILDLPRFGARRDRVVGRELWHRGRRSVRSLFGQGMMGFLGAEVNGPHSLGLIFEGIGDVNRDVRVEAVRMIDEIGPAPAVVDALARTLDDDSPEVRKRAARAISEHGSWSTVALLEHVVGRSERATQSVLEVLGARKSGDGITTLRKAYRDLSGDLRIEAAIQLGLAEAPDAAGPLLEALEVEENGRRFRRIRDAVNRVVPDEDRRLRDVLARVASGASTPAAVYAAEELAALGDVAFARHLLAHLESVDAGQLELTDAAAAVAAADPSLLAEVSRFVSAASLRGPLVKLPSDRLEDLRREWLDSGADGPAAEVEAILALREREASNPRTEAGRQRAAEIAAKASAAGVPTESPEEVFAKVLGEEERKGSSSRVAQARAKSARLRSTKDLLERSAADEDGEGGAANGG